MATYAHTTPARAGERYRAQNLFAVAGELLTALVIVVGGIAAYGLVTFA